MASGVGCLSRNGWWDFMKSWPDSPVSHVKRACEGVETSIFISENRFAIRDGLSLRPQRREARRGGANVAPVSSISSKPNRKNDHLSSALGVGFFNNDPESKTIFGRFSGKKKKKADRTEKGLRCPTPMLILNETLRPV